MRSIYDNPLQKYLPFRPQVIITEDAGAGYQFFKKIAIYLPESFEWLILSSGVVKVEDDSLIQQTWQYADSVGYASWEQYYSELLTDITRDSDYLRYNKKKLSAYYNQERVEKDIIDSIKGIDFN